MTPKLSSFEWHCLSTRAWRRIRWCRFNSKSGCLHHLPFSLTYKDLPYRNGSSEADHSMLGGRVDRSAQQRAQTCWMAHDAHISQHQGFTLWAVLHLIQAEVTYEKHRRKCPFLAPTQRQISLLSSQQDMLTSRVGPYPASPLLA